MIVKGIYNEAVVYTDTIEETAADQIALLCSQKFAAGSRIRIMPDVHAGAGCVIGFTADLGEMVIPNIVGVDIGCGMLTVELGKLGEQGAQERLGEQGAQGEKAAPDFEKLDHVIRSFVPSGKEVHEGRMVRFPKLQELHCYRSLKNSRRLERSIGTLGGGNHFIEVDVDEDECYYLVIHSGSRNLGKQVAEYYQQLAYDLLRGKDKLFEEQNRIIEEYKKAGRKKEIQGALKELHRAYEAKDIDLPKSLCYLTGEYRQMYLDDMAICQEFAVMNRAAIADIILEKWLGARPCGTKAGGTEAGGTEAGVDCSEIGSTMPGGVVAGFPHFETIHNYIDHENNLVRKGAVSAQKGQRLLIPMNMRDGSLICIGKGNPEWNWSAPHGAGRLFSRAGAKARFDVESYAKAMEGVYTTSVSEATLDECPMAYKPMEEILKYLGETARVEKIIRPVYNFKAGE